MNIRPIEQTYEATYYDGVTSELRSGTVSLLPTALRMDLADRSLTWPYEQCRLECDSHYGEPARIAPKDSQGEAIVIEDPQFVTALGQYHQPLVARPWWDARLEGWAATLRSAAAAVLLSAGFYFYGIGLLAELAAILAPRSVEQRLGDSTVQLLVPKSLQCQPNDAARLLARIEQPLFRASESQYPFRVVYSNMRMANAFAAPGGTIIVTQGLLELTQNEDEYAAVIAHEIQHVKNRDSMRAIARELGGSIILAMLAVDPAANKLILEQSGKLLELSFSRDAESTADSGAAKLLIQSGRNPSGLESFLKTLESAHADDEDPLKYLSTHPPTRERVADLQRWTANAPPGRQILTAEEWTRAKKICPASD
jgi:Zn-dependent protease with chaperone function